MSLILEALRKSEAERRRDNAPNVALELPPAPTRNPRNIPLWVWPLGLAILGLLVLASWMGQRAGERDKAANTPHSTASALRVDAAPAAPAPVIAQTPAQAIQPAPPPAPQPAPQLTPQLAPAPAPTSAAPPTTVATNTAPATTSLPPPRPQPAAPSAPQSTLAQTAPAQAAHTAPNLADTGLPAVKLSMHMWDAEPSKRFVILDGQRMGEGDRAGALSVITIERSGVLIERNGQRARIPLP